MKKPATSTPTRATRDDEPDGYYEDDGEFLYDEDLPRGLRQRMLAVLGTSYGTSIMVHAALLLLLASIMIAAPERDERVILEMKLPPPRLPYREEPERDTKRQQEVPIPEQAELPRVDLVEEPVTPDIPKGHEEAIANKQVAVDALSMVDAIGVGQGRPAGAYGRQDGIGRVGERGGGKDTEDAVLAALRWLARHQSPDGSWDCDDYLRCCKLSTPCSGAGAEPYDVGVSSLALLAYLGHGNTHRYGDFKRTVAKGLRWLRSQQRADGSLGYESGGHSRMYNHALATMVLCEAYGVSLDPGLRRPAQRAVDFCLAAQNPGLGWRYGIRDGQNDTSVTGWMVLALKAARVANLEVPQAAFDGAKRWLDRVTAGDGSAGYQGPGGGSSVLGGNEQRFEPNMTMTAVAVVCRLFTGERASSDPIRKGARLVAADPPRWDPRRLSYYYWYYGTYALYHFDDKRWQPWNQAMKAALLPHQEKGGCADGSWGPDGEWSQVGGRVYSTAMGALTLQIYYRYEREHGAKPK